MNKYNELAEFFKAWRAFHAPHMIDGVPDYSAGAMAKQHQELTVWKRLLEAFDITGWPIPHQIDWYLIWAEMNGLEFAHRVTQPWVRDPAFYVWFYPQPTDVPDREGPYLYGAIELSNYPWPLSDADATGLADRLRRAPAVFTQACTNLTGNARDLWITGTRSIREQSEHLAAFAETIVRTHPYLAAAAQEACEASNQFANWLTARAASKTGPSGVGRDNYTWNLRNVHLLPYSWEEEKLLLQRELARAHATLRLEEHRNRKLPSLSQVDNAADFDRMFSAAVTEYVAFLEEEEILSVKPYMDPALRAPIGHFIPAEGPREFFNEISYRAPIVLRTHHYHYIELARMREEPNASPIRRISPLYNIFDSRAEGVATGMEEMMMHAGLLDKRPRVRELIWILLALRAARGLGELYQHGLQMNFNEATQFASKWTPWSLLPAEGVTIQHEMQLYLRQPAYGTSYVIGKIEIERLIAEYARQREARFVLKSFMNEINRIGVIPVSLVHWELTGDKSMLDAAIAGIVDEK